MTRKTDSGGRLHSDDGPAVMHQDGSFVYYKHGLIHRIDGPAVRLVFSDGRVETQFWYNGKEVQDVCACTPVEITKETQNQKAA